MLAEATDYDILLFGALDTVRRHTFRSVGRKALDSLSDSLLDSFEIATRNDTPPYHHLEGEEAEIAHQTLQRFIEIQLKEPWLTALGCKLVAEAWDLVETVPPVSSL